MDNPKLYAKNNQFQRQIVAAVVKEHLEKFIWRSDQKDTIIDIGSGTGDMLMEVICPLLAKKFQRIVSSDLNPIMLNHAKTHYQTVENSEFMILDIGTELGMPPELRGQFDHVVSFYCIHLVNNQIQAFENIYDLLRSDEGGDCLLNLFASGPYYDAYIALSQTSKWSEYMTDVGKYTSYWHYVKNPEQDARLMLEQCGFSNTEVKLCRSFYDFESVECFKATMLAVSHYVHRMPQELHTEFMNDFVVALTNSSGKCKVLDDGAFRFYYEQLVIYARKPPKEYKS